ncbi:MAG: gliding motility-associated C-terminal domain-containing protein, partial [Bacteroidota bacterium]
TYIRWKFSTQNLSVTCLNCVKTAFYPIDNADYSLKIVNEYGCVAIDDLSIKVDHEVYVANVFSPSKQAPDNVFFIQSKNPIAISYLKVFDRWGNAVFERNNLFTNDISTGWDGNFNNRKAALGVYVWIAELAHANGVKEKIQGNVTLVD